MPFYYVANQRHREKSGASVALKCISKSVWVPDLSFYLKLAGAFFTIATHNVGIFRCFVPLESMTKSVWVPDLSFYLKSAGAFLPWQQTVQE